MAARGGFFYISAFVLRAALPDFKTGCGGGVDFAALGLGDCRRICAVARHKILLLDYGLESRRSGGCRMAVARLVRGKMARTPFALQFETGIGGCCVG